MNLPVEELLRQLPSAKRIASELYGVRWRGNRARCPRADNHTHGDRDPSFAYLDKENRLKCFSKQCFGEKPIDAIDFVGQMEHCTFQDAVRRLAERYVPGFIGSSNGHHPPREQRKKSGSRADLESRGWRVVAEYPMGEGVRKLRLEHPARLQEHKNRPEKTFLWEHLDADGTWRSGRDDRHHVVYVNAPFRDLDQVESVLGVESERSADSVGKLGFPAFSFKELTEQNAAAFAGLDVRVLPDKDDAGRKLVDRAIALLRPHVRSLAMIEPPSDWAEAGDIHDAIADGGWDADRVTAFLKTARPIQVQAKQRDKAPKPTLRVWSLAELRAANFETPTPIIEDMVAEGETVGVVGKPKTGKSRLVQQSALAVSRGEAFLGHVVPRARRVLMLDLENRPRGVRARFQKMSCESPGDERLLIYAPDTLSDLHVTLATNAGVQALRQLVAEVKPELLIIDTWRLLLGGDENKTEVVVRGLRALSSLRQILPALAIIVVHHTRKAQGQDPPLLRIDPSAWVENASGHYSFIAHLDACFGMEREVDRKSGDELIVFGGVSRSAAPRTLLLDEDPVALTFCTSHVDDVVQKLLTEKERAAWLAVESLAEFTFGDAVERARTKNRKLVSSMLRKMTSMNLIEKGIDGIYRNTAG